MMQFDRIILGQQAKELGFVRDTLEKVIRLAAVLDALERDSLLSDCLALKGGTAINLTIFDLPRLSVDIDLDFSQMLPRQEMLTKRAAITEHIRKHMRAMEYVESARSKFPHALDSFVFEYQNAGGMRDNLKIEINYMLRCHILEPTRRAVNLPWLDHPSTVLSIAPIEIFASKIVALLNRAAPRDLYDVRNMIRFELFGKTEQDLLRKCVVFYSAIASESVPLEYNYNKLEERKQRDIKSDLTPVLRNGKFFDLDVERKIVINYLKELIQLSNREKLFLENFKAQRFCPDLLFDDPSMVDRIASHPMAEWKMSQQRIQNRGVRDDR